MAKSEISFTAFNLYNLNIPHKRMYRDYNGWSDDEYNSKILWASEVIKSLQSTIWGFQELWNKEALVKVFNESNVGANYDILTPNNHNGKSIVCGAAVLKNKLVGQPEWIHSFPGKFILESAGDDSQTPKISVTINEFSRPPLKFKIKHDNKEIIVFVCHLKSKLATDISDENWYKNDIYYKNHSEGIGSTISTIRRTAEAAALRMMLVDELKGTNTPVVVLGDFNDNQHSNTLNIVTGQPNYLRGLTKGGSDTDLYSVATLEELKSLRDVYYTHVFQNVKESLDHILVSQEFYSMSKKKIWALRGMEIYNDHLNTENHKETGTTDHGIVKAVFK